MGRLSVYGPGAARLHEEIIPVTAIWTEAERDRKPLRPLGESGEERTLNQLEEALRNARPAPAMAAARIQTLVERDIADLVPTFERIATERLEIVKGELAKRGEAELRLLSELLDQQRNRIAKASAEYDPDQLMLPGIADEERREHEGDRRHWQARLLRLEKEIAKVEADIKRVDAKLNNPEFVRKAPEEIIEGEKEKREEAEGRRAKLLEALERLKGAV